MNERINVETVALLSLGKLAQQQLAAPKNRAKNVPAESLAQLIRMAQAELDEALHALRSGRGTTAVMEELGDAAAFVGLAMWRATEDAK